MKTRKSLAVIAGLSLSLACQAQTPPTNAGSSYSDTARITHIQVLTQHINQPQQLCSQIPVTQQTQVQSSNHGLAGAVIGGVTGGLLGHTVGKGMGKDAATAGGAVVGALVGEQLQNKQPTTVTSTQTVTQCYVVDAWVDRQTGAIVTYRYQGRNFTESLPYVPNFRAGDDVQLRVRTSLEGHWQS